MTCQPHAAVSIGSATTGNSGATARHTGAGGVLRSACRCWCDGDCRRSMTQLVDEHAPVRSACAGVGGRATWSSRRIAADTARFLPATAHYAHHCRADRDHAGLLARHYRHILCLPISERGAARSPRPTRDERHLLLFGMTRRHASWRAARCRAGRQRLRRHRSCMPSE